MADLERIAQRVKALRKKHAMRDFRAAQVRAVRHGDFDLVAPDLFSDEWPRPIVANHIETYALHAAAALSPLPALSCQALAETEVAKKFADKKAKIVNHYFRRSRVQAQMMGAADQFYSYGLIVTEVAPDFTDGFPSILMRDSIGYYPVWDAMGRTIEIARVFRLSVMDVKAQYPMVADKIDRKYGNGKIVDPSHKLDLVRWEDKDRIVLYVDDSPDMVLFEAANPAGRCTTVATRRPGLDDEIRGKFDDLIWVQLALHAYQVYTLSAVATAVNAPVAVPMDVADIPIGPNEIIKSNDPGAIRRVQLDVPQSAWAAQEYLSRELESGAIVPEALGGSIDASVVTGKGVQQLMAGYSQQIAMAQESLVGHFEQVAQIALLVDETYWPKATKAISGQKDGSPYRVTYTPEKDIAGDYDVDVQYGGVAGLDPNRSLVFMLQGQAAGLFSKDLTRRNMPVAMNPEAEERKIRLELIRDGLTQGAAGVAQQWPEMLLNGMNPAEMLGKLAKASDLIDKGEDMEDVMRKLFPEQPPQQQPAMEQAAAATGTPPAEAAAIQPDAGGRPPLSMFFAGVSPSGNANLQAGVSRMEPASA